MCSIARKFILNTNSFWENFEPFCYHCRQKKVIENGDLDRSRFVWDLLVSLSCKNSLQHTGSSFVCCPIEKIGFGVY
jgi:hypothetical protein